MVLVLFFAAYHAEALFRGGSYLHWDVLFLFYPWRSFAGEGLRAGLLPLWNPYNFCGVNLAGNPQAALLYPGTWLFSWQNVPQALLLHQLLHQALAAWGTFALASSLGLATLPALFSGMTFAFSAAMAVKLPFINLAAALSYLPWSCLAGFRLGQGERLAASARLGLFLGLALLAGQPREALYDAAGALIFFLYARGGRKTVVGFRFFASGLGLSPLLALGLILPFLDFLGRTVRGQGLSPEQVSAGGWKPLHFLHLILPFSPWDPSLNGGSTPPQIWSGLGYAGFWSLALCIPGWKASRPRSRRWWLIFSLATVALAMGPAFKPWSALARLPGFSLLRYTETVLIGLTLGLALMAGRGLQALQMKKNKSKREKATAKARAWLAAGLGLLLLFFPGWGSLSSSGPPLGLGREALRATGIFLLGSPGLPGLCLAQALDLADVRRRILPAAPDRFFSDPNPEGDSAKSLAGPGRLYYSPAAELESHELGMVRGASLSMLRRRLVPNLPLVEGLRMVEGYDALRPRRLDQFMASLLGPQGPPWERKHFDLLSAPLAAFVPRERGEGKPEMALKTQPARPRAFFTAWRKALSPEEALAELGEAGDVLPLEAEGIGEGAQAPGRVVSWSEDRWGQIRVELEGVTKPGWLFVSLGFDPGLRAESWGEARLLAPAALAFTAVELKPGDQILRLAYKPDTFLVGLFGSLLGLALVLALLSGWRGASEGARG